MAAIRILVKAGKTGVGHVKPFGTYDKHQKGATVTIGEKKYKVNSRGSITIPKSIMSKIGTKDKAGKKNVVVQFSAMPGLDGWKHASAIIIKALPHYVNFKNGSRVTNIGKAKRNKKNEYTNRLIPMDFPEQNYSP